MNEINLEPMVFGGWFRVKDGVSFWVLKKFEKKRTCFLEFLGEDISVYMYILATERDNILQYSP